MVKRSSPRPSPAKVADTEPWDSASPLLLWLLIASAFGGAFLLFLVQPLLGKAILPWYGGAAGVWSLCLVFYQTGLLAGYAYAHLVVRRLPLAAGVTLHTVLLVAACFLAPITPSFAWKPAFDDDPASSILQLLTVCAGAPYLLVAATAPLVQAWFTAAYRGAAPYRLYAVSNAGSLAALAAYPLLIEPNLGVRAQGWTWSGAFMAFTGVCVAAGWMTVRSARSENAISTPSVQGAPPHVVAAVDRLIWVLAPAIGTALLVSATTYMTQDIAAFPLLWIVPLALFLLSFILAFDSPAWRRRWLWTGVAAIASVSTAIIWEVSNDTSLGLQLGAHCLLVFSLCMLLHTELFARRPPPEGLTGYYLAISAGGAVGGALIALVSPHVLSQQLELPIVVAAAWALQFVVLYTDHASSLYRGGRYWCWGLMLGVYVNYLAVMMLSGGDVGMQLVARARNFYGELRVLDYQAPGETPETARRQLRHGRIQHGRQLLAPELRDVPTSYYVVESGIGRVLTQLQRSEGRRIGAVGLGVGTIAAYGEPGDSIRFYEINPQVEMLAREYFTFLADSEASIEVAVGDARLVLESEVAAEAPRLDVLVLDAFSGDAVPAHLLTIEAFQVYFKRLKDDGILAVHISNRYLELPRLLRGLAASQQAEAQYVEVQFSREDPILAARADASVWVLLSRAPGVVTSFGAGVPIEFTPASRDPVVWTDDFSNIFELVTFFRLR